MKICNDAAKHPPYAGKHRAVLLAACIWGLMTGCCAHADMPKGYFDDGEGLPLSANCSKRFARVLLPETSLTTNHHQYVLLLTFDNVAHSQFAGEKLFGADLNPGKKTAACLDDPDLHEVTKAGGLGSGLKVKGGCPSDCIEPNLEAKKAPRRSGEYEADPMSQYPQGNVHWGLYFVGDDGQSESSVRVWQIRVRDGVHATALYNKLVDAGLLQMPGYQGHLLIGHRPMPRD